MSKWISSVAKGWRPIVKKAIEELEAKGAYIFQVKEKFGGLRIYYHPAECKDVDGCEAIVRKAEAEAAVTCEACGKPGKETDVRGWMKTVCPEHENGFDRSAYE